MAASHHTSVENIWGKDGCQLPNGERCNICCLVRGVPEMNKAEGIPCRNQTTEGCKIHDKPTQPPRCKTYHCSQDMGKNNQILRFCIVMAQNRSLVTAKEANQAIDRLPLRDVSKLW